MLFRRLWGVGNASPTPLGVIDFQHSEASAREAEICSAQAFHAVLVRERARANRNGHMFSLLMFDLSAISSMSLAELIQTLRQRVRSIDEVGWLDVQRVGHVGVGQAGRIGVVLPYTAAEAAWTLADAICHQLGVPAGQPTCSVYTYPTAWELEHVSSE